MIDELRKSINATLYERVSSPFYGTGILSWLIWNWEIPYLTFVISEDQIKGTKLEYISTHYSNIHKGKLVVVLNGFQKKTQKTPKNEIKLAEKLQKQYYDEQN